jgi:hypothetical protein
MFGLSWVGGAREGWKCEGGERKGGRRRRAYLDHLMTTTRRLTPGRVSRANVNTEAEKERDGKMRSVGGREKSSSISLSFLALPGVSLSYVLPFCDCAHLVNSSAFSKSRKSPPDQNHIKSMRAWHPNHLATLVPGP